MRQLLLLNIDKQKHVITHYHPPNSLQRKVKLYLFYDRAQEVEFLLYPSERNDTQPAHKLEESG